MTTAPTLDPIELPYVPVYINDWLGMTSHLPLDVQAALLRLVMHQWKHRSVPGHDPKALALIIGSGVTTAQARRIWAAVEPLYTQRLVDNSSQIPKWEEWRAEAERKARTNKGKAVKAARTRWDGMQRPPSNAPSTPLGNAPSNAPSIPPSNASQSQSQGSSSGSHQIGGLEPSQAAAETRPSAPVENERRPGPTLIPRGGNIAWFNQMEAKHRGCHPEVCHWKDSNVRVCMPSAQVSELAGKLPSMAQPEAVAFVIDWARRDAPPEGYVVPSSEFEHWRTRWDATMAKRSEASTTRSTVPSVEATAKRYLS